MVKRLTPPHQPSLLALVKLYPQFNAQAANALAGMTAPPLQSQPAADAADNQYLQAVHVNTLNVAMLDSSVKPINCSIDPVVFWSAVTPAGGETASL